MGLFDSVWFDCPTCGNPLEFQSKAMPDPYMNRYPPDNVPLPIAVDAVLMAYDLGDQGRGWIACKKCGHKWEIYTNPPIPTRVALYLRTWIDE